MSSTDGQLSTAGETNGRGSSSSTPMRTAATYARKLRPYLSQHARSGTMSGVTGGLSVLRGIRTIRRGRRLRGLARILTGLVMVGVAVTQRRNAQGKGGSAGGDVDQSDVVSTAPDDLEAAATGDAGVEHHEDVDGAVDTGPDVGDVDPDERGVDLGEADLDEREVVDTGTDAVDAAEESEEAETSDESGTESSDDAETETVGDDVEIGTEAADDGDGDDEE